MLHFEYKSGEIGIYDAARQTFSMNVIFFYDEKITYQQMHLLEHIILHPNRKLESGAELHMLIEAYPPINGFTAGNFLVFKFSCYVDDAEYLSNILLDLISKPINISQEEINKEIAIIEKENEHLSQVTLQLEKLSKNPLIRNDILIQGKITPEQIEQWFLYGVKNNRPLILLSGDTHHEGVSNAISTINSWLIAQPAKNTNHEIFYDRELEKGKRPEFPSGLKDISMFSSMPHKENQYYFYHILLYLIMEELLFEQCRVNEGSDYDADSSFRNTLYSQETIFNFKTKLSSEELYQLVENFFNKGEEYFERKKKKIRSETHTWEDLPTEYYQIAQIYFFTKTFHRARFVGEQIQAISYKNFMEYYKMWYEYTTFIVDGPVPHNPS